MCEERIVLWKAVRYVRTMYFFGCLVCCKLYLNYRRSRASTASDVFCLQTSQQYFSEGGGALMCYVTRPPSKSHWGGRKSGVVVHEGFDLTLHNINMF